MLHARTSEGSLFRRASRAANPRPEYDTITTRSARLQAPGGNQAALRMLAGAMAPAIQRQTAEAMNGGGGNGGGTDGGVTPTGIDGGTAPTARSWSAGDITAILSDKGSNCWGSSRGQKYSDKCGPVKGPFCQAAGVTFIVDFVVDFSDAPRPQPFSAPYVSVYFKLTGSGGATKTEINKNDPNPRYVAPGAPLEPSFGHEFTISSSENANLWVDLHIFDPDSGTSVDYQDNIKFVVTPCT